MGLRLARYGFWGEFDISDSFLRHATWIAVCDGQRALLLENRGDREFPKLETREVFKQENPPTHLQGSAPPGRTFSSAGGRRSATEETDFHEQLARTFLDNFAQRLNDCVGEHNICALVLIATARALGALRPLLGEAVRHVLVAELDRDYVKMPLYEIERHLSFLSS